MMNKKIYESPALEVLEIEIEDAILQTSTDQSGVSLTADDHVEFDIWQ